MIETRISRRGVFGLAAGAAASLAGAALLGHRACRMAGGRRLAVADHSSSVDYIERDGWMLTAADSEHLATASSPQ
jgi:hypothetical protein